ncbi:T9SS type B sorting domain-containing protein [Tenacibaculum sp. SG-28]|uniref:T9SS type B sorting domain-containing protein n=1 Tax=Tenacibaculum sp. SG-28 TaxID=754426 RepID=UPI000CF3F698|nr:T9SS type B sorting domain-containing protein [Tenacibaculum sp. SG-28]PQJ23111.1 hypothetical protein BSU00_02320 [Tenacibaculum sp. SG-28]
MVVTADDICFGSATGEIQITEINTNINPLTYAITNSPANAFNGPVTSLTIGNLVAGNYTIEGTGTNGCTFSKSIEIKENPQLDVPDAAVAVSNFSCTTNTNDVNFATVTVDPTKITGGSGTFVRYVFEFEETGSGIVIATDTQDSTNPKYVVTNEAGGTVNITVYDNQGCAGTATTTIPPFSKLETISVAVDNAITCTTQEDITVSYTGININPSQLTYRVVNADTSVDTTNSSGDFDGLPTGFYTVSIINTATNCIISTTHEVFDKPEFFLELSKDQNVSCFGATDGAFTVTFSTATPYADTYDYVVYDAITNTATSITGTNITGGETINGLGAGSYYVVATMTASPFCPVTSPTVTIEGPAAALDLSLTNTPVSCVGGSDASITATATNGWGGYEFQLENASGIIEAYSTTKVFNGLSAGTYTITVRDANGCPVSQDITIDNPDPIVFTLAKDDQACDATSGGSITVIATGGTGSYTYVLLEGTTVIRTQTTNVFDDLGAGTYTVEVSDTNSCSAAASTPITLVPNLVFTVTETKKIDCSPTPDGTVEIKVTQGSGSYAYEVEDSAGNDLFGKLAITGTSESFVVTTADTYKVRVYDTAANPECAIEKNIVIAEPILPIFRYEKEDSTCAGSNSGVIRLYADANGILPLSYSITPDVGNFNATANSFENLPPGTYAVTGTGTNGCATTKTVIISEPQPIVLPTPVVTEFSCITANETELAAITIPNSGADVITGGSGNYIRVIFTDTKGTTDAADDEIVQDGPSLTYTTANEQGGIFQVEVFDDKGCSAIETATIAAFSKFEDATVTVDKLIECTAGENITVTYSVTNPLAAGVDVSFTITKTGDSFTETNTTGSFVDLSPGFYTIAITNPTTGCIYAVNHEVLETPEFLLDINKTSNVACLGGTEGEISFTFSSTTPYTGLYSYEVFNTTGSVGSIVTGASGLSTAGNLPAGEYYVVVTMEESPFCPVTSSTITIEGPTTALDIALTSTAISCIGSSDASITATASNGWGGYEFQLEDASGTVLEGFSTSTVFTGLAAGDYVVIVRDANGCEQRDTITITDPTAITFTLSKDDQSCDATSGGTITVSALGGTGDYVYILYDTVSGNELRRQTDAVFTNLGAGEYTVMVNDSKGCSAASNASITLLPDLEFTIAEIKKLDCSVTRDAEIEISITSGSGSYAYEVSNSAGVVYPRTPITTGATSVIFTVNTADTYTVQVYDVAATPECIEVLSVSVLDPILPIFNYDVEDSTCFGANNGVIRLYAEDNGVSPLTYAITNAPDASLIGTTSSFEFTNLPPGIYEVTATGTNSCTTAENITVEEPQEINVPFVTVSEFGCTIGNDTTFASITVDEAQVTGGSQTYNRVVFTDTSTNAVVQDDSSFVFTSTDTDGGTYLIQVYDDKGCVGSTTATIQPFEVLLSAVVNVTQEIDCDTNETIQVDVSSSIPVAAGDLTYSISGQNSGFTATNTTGEFTNLVTDIYTIAIEHTITGCILETSHEVDAIPTFSLNVTKTSNATCIGSATGSFTVDFSTASPYAGLYSYEVYTAAGTTTGITGSGATGVTTISDLVAGEYYVVIRMEETPDCEVTSPTVTIEDPTAALSLVADAQLISCITSDSGEVVLTAAGGWGGYTYEVTNTTTGIVIQSFASTSSVTGLNAGLYEATVKDALGCEETITFELLNPEPITADFSVVENLCNGEQNATITITNVQGGQGNPANYTYALTYPNGTISANQASNVFTDLTEGSYSFVVYDEFVCASQPVTVTITDPTKVIASASVVAPITCDRTQAIVEVSGAGGAGTYEYSTDGITFVSSNVFTVDAGKHQLYVRDANGCVSDPFELVTVDRYDPIDINLDIESAFITCKGENNGVLTANVIDGGFNNYEYELLDASGAIVRPVQASNTFEDLAEGSYKIRVYTTNSNGDVCIEDTAVQSIAEPELLQVAASQINLSCNGGADGSITVNAEGGNEGYEYNISPGFPSNKFVDYNVFENLTAGEYTITVKDKVGCFQTITRTIVEPSEVAVDLSAVVQQECILDPSPTITIEASGGSVTPGTATYIVSINGIDLPGTYPEGTITLGAAEGIEANQFYGISIRSNDTCAPKELDVVATTKPVDLQLENLLEYNCPNGNVLSASVQEEYKDVVVYSLYDDGILQASNDTGIFTNLAPSDKYTIEAEHINKGCPVDIPIQEVIEVQELELTLDDSQMNLLIANGNFGVPPYEYSFDGGDFDISNQITIYETRDYTVRIRDARGCELELIIQGNYITIEVPNIFSPNGDGTNDYWYPKNVRDYHNLEVLIFDRYARNIVSYTGLQEGWDGTYEGKNLPTGDYWYTIYFTELSGQRRKIMGHFTLYR